MAWLDDRAWCHPKLVDLPPLAFKAYICSISYASGMNTRGVLTPAQQKLVGSNNRIKNVLLSAGLWDEKLQKNIEIHDWDAHNGKRDDRRAQDRERKRQERASERQNTTERPQDSPVDCPQDESAPVRKTVHSPVRNLSSRARPRSSEGSEGSEELPPFKEPEPAPNREVNQADQNGQGSAELIPTVGDEALRLLASLKARAS
jgi:hypothetical protein